MPARIVLILLMLACSLQPVSAEEVAYVSARQTKIYKEANLNSDLMTVLKQDEQVLVLDQQGVWWQIRYTDLSGLAVAICSLHGKTARRENFRIRAFEKFFR